MSEELIGLKRQWTWSLVPYSSSQHVSCRWAYKIKHHFDGSRARYKARLVAKGFHQAYGTHYTDTFSLVVKHSTIRVELALAVHFQWQLHQLDATNAFLLGILEEDFYMTQPQGVVDNCFPNHVYNLHKSIYGPKQATRTRFGQFSSYLVGTGFSRTYRFLSICSVL